MKPLIRFILIICASFAIGQTNAIASETDSKTSYTILPDSSNFVISSILIATPGNELFYTLGHCALRLQCPSEDLDYCFSFNTIVDQGLTFNILLMSGNLRAGYEAVKYDDYMKPFYQSGRGVYEYPLNLTLGEERELWRLMDNQMLKGPIFKFDFMFNNCTGPLFRSLESILQKEKLVYTQEYPLTLNTRERMRVSLGSPWFDFFSIIMLSSYYCKEDFPLSVKVYPELWGNLLAKAKIVNNNGDSRNALEGPVRQLAPQTLQLSQPKITPTLLFGIIFALCLLVTLLEFFKGWLKIPNILDKVLFILYLFFSFYLLYTSCIKLFGTASNWFLFVFNPLPLLIWLLFRHKKCYPIFWVIYTVVILSFMLFLPLYTGAMEWPHELLMATLLIRVYANYKQAKHKI